MMIIAMTMTMTLLFYNDPSRGMRVIQMKTALKKQLLTQLIIENEAQKL